MAEYDSVCRFGLQLLGSAVLRGVHARNLRPMTVFVLYRLTPATDADTLPVRINDIKFTLSFVTTVRLCHERQSLTPATAPPLPATVRASESAMLAYVLIDARVVN